MNCAPILSAAVTVELSSSKTLTLRLPLPGVSLGAVKPSPHFAVVSSAFAAHPVRTSA